MIFPGSQIRVVHRRGSGSTDNSITSQTVKPAITGPHLLLGLSQGITNSSSQSFGNQEQLVQISKVPSACHQEGRISQIHAGRDSEWFVRAEGRLGKTCPEKAGWKITAFPPVLRILKAPSPDSKSEPLNHQLISLATHAFPNCNRCVCDLTNAFVCNMGIQMIRPLVFTSIGQTHMYILAQKKLSFPPPSPCNGL